MTRPALCARLLLAAVIATACAPCAAASGREALFGDEGDGSLPASTASPWRGYVQAEVARQYHEPAHWSKARLRMELGREGRLDANLKWKIGARVDYDAAYDRSTFYPPAVRDDQRADVMLRENYLDYSAGDWELQVGRQHVIWGEMVGTFVADVVSARDMREFILPDFGQIRIPQWAARAEYFKNDFHAELLWIPLPSVDRIGKPGADFYPYPIPAQANYLGEELPQRKLANTNYGVRLSQLVSGWDLSAFYYHSVDVMPTFYRVSAPAAPLVFQPRHDHIDQAGGTLTKDLGTSVLKAELVYTGGRRYNLLDPGATANGLVRQNTLDYAVGLDMPVAGETRVNVQFIQRVFFDHAPGILFRQVESGASVLVTGKLAPTVEAKALLISSLERSDWLVSPQIAWRFERNWRLAVGADVLGGQKTGIFGRFDRNDRVYGLLRYDF